MSARLQYLFDRHVAKTCTDEERQELLGMSLEPELQERVKEVIADAWLQTGEQEDMSEEKAAALMEQLFPTRRNKVVSLSWRRIAVAASILLIIGLGSYFIFFNKTVKPVEIAKTQEERFKNDVNPGENKATLTLADGRIIVLDSAGPGELTRQGGTAVLNKDGQLVYDVQDKTNEVLYNILSTAKGETYATVLADGSKVWLNSASSIRYPVSFTGSDRKVEITGEAYFEVAKDANKKFFVTGNGVTTEVLGTHFNVNTYADEGSINVTLLEGSVKVSKGSSTGILKPGQQAQAGDNIEIVSDVDLEEVMAWKNGRFYFESADIKSIMRQIERWYDVEIIYQDEINYSFVADISRNVRVSEMLRLLELTNLVHFKIEGKKITVMK